MRNGYNASPETLLWQFLDINLRDPRFAFGISQIVESKLVTFLIPTEFVVGIKTRKTKDDSLICLRL